VVGDDKDFDPTFLLNKFDKLILWGGNHYANLLPTSRGWLIWNKRDHGESGMHSDAELAWTTVIGMTRCHNQFWQGAYRTGESPSFLHPTQKPVQLMQWCIELSEAKTVCEPFAGSGTTLVACQNLNRKCYAMEISENYCAVILERMATAFPSLEIKRIENAEAAS
jgi:site-specific DNA-methyltransferase (adenine-specific)